MAKNVLKLLVTASLLMGCWTLPAAEAPKPLTNADIVELVRLGLPADSIAMAIRFATETRGTDFDVSSAAMAEMARRGAGAAILDAMRAMPETKPVSKYQDVFGNDNGNDNGDEAWQGATSASGFPWGTGIYFQSSAGWVALPSSVLWPEARGTWKEMLAVGYRDWAMEVPGPRAAIRISNSRPTFHCRGFSPDGSMYLVRVSARTDRREFRVSGADVLNRTTRFKDMGSLRPVELQRVDRDLFTLRPTSDLDAGEYMIVASVAPGQRWVLFGFDFAVGGSR